MSPTQGERNVSRLTADTIAMVLSGGKGSGLHGLTERRAKPAVPFGGKFRIIDFPLSNCINSDIRRISVLTQFESRSLHRHLQRGWSFLSGQCDEFVEVLPPQQGVSKGWYKGTADAVYRNLDMIRLYDPQYVLILSGDQIYKMDYGKMIAAHAAYGADVTVGCIPVPLEEAKAFGVLTVDEGERIIDFTERPEIPNPMVELPGKALASMGIYVFTASFLRDRLLEDADLETSSHDFGKDMIPSAIQNARVFGFRFMNTITAAAKYWRYVETLDAYWEASMDLVSVQPELDLYDTNWPIWTNQQQLPPAKFLLDENGRRGHAVDSIVSEGCLVNGAAVRRTVLSSNTRVHSRSEVEDSVVLPEVEISSHCRIKRAIIDKGVVIPEGMEIGHDLKQDRERFEVSEGGVVLVTSDMLGQGVHQL